jgi:DNA-binding transcriptional LysR family regulator
VIGPADLTTFLAISERRTIHRAVMELRVSPSALSPAVRGIEDRPRLRLFNSATHCVARKEAGERLFARISPAFKEDALEDLNRLPSLRGRG